MYCSGLCSLRVSNNFTPSSTLLAMVDLWKTSIIASKGSSFSQNSSVPAFSNVAYNSSSSQVQFNLLNSPHHSEGSSKISGEMASTSNSSNSSQTSSQIPASTTDSTGSTRSTVATASLFAIALASFFSRFFAIFSFRSIRSFLVSLFFFIFLAMHIHLQILIRFAGRHL